MALSVIELKNIIDGKEMASHITDAKKTTIICPNPALADELRESLSPHSSSNFQTLTIAKFTSELLEHFSPDKEVMRKSELKLLLSTLWKIKFKDTSSASFDQCFDILTDLRSYTLESHLIESVLERLSEDIGECVRYFWLLMQEQEIVDEHLGYDLLTRNLETTEVDESFNNNENYMFVGFSHLSSNQINFLRALARRFDVYLPIGKMVLENYRPSDWISWIVENSKVIRSQAESCETKIVKVMRFPKGSLASALQMIEEPFENLIFPVKNISTTQLLELSSKDFYFKIPSDLTHLASTQIFENIEQQFFYDVKKTYLVDEFIEKLSIRKEDLLKKEKSFKVFLKLKVILLFIENINNWKELSEVNSEITHFDFGVLRESVSLDLPRLFNIPLKQNYTHECFGHQNLFRCFEKNNIICLTSNHDLSVGEGSNYPFEVNEVLKTLGPVRQKTLDSLIVKDQMLSLAQKGNTTFLVETGIEVHDSFMDVFLSDLEYEESTVETLTLRKKSVVESEVSHSEVDVLSPTRLQSYIDCPKKYHYNYNDKLSNEPEKESLIDPRHLGSLEHLVFECLLKDSSVTVEDLILEKAERFFSKKILLNTVSRREILAEVVRFVTPVISHFRKLQSLDPEIEFVFEQDLHDKQARGRVDLIVKSDLFGNMLIDMKRSSSSIPTKSSLEKMQSIQIWYYLNFLKDIEFTTFGYLSFAEPETSLFFSLNSDISEKLNSIEFLNLKKIEKLKNPIDEYLNSFNEVYEDSIRKVSANEFPVAPINAQVCTFCPGSVICPKA